MAVKRPIEAVLEQAEQIGFVCFPPWFCLLSAIVESIIGISNFISNLSTTGGEKPWERGCAPQL